MSPAQVRVREVELRVSDCDARLPFRFGAATVTWAPLVTARVVLDVDGERAEGFSADLAMPRWFDKDPAKTILENVTGLVHRAIRVGEAFDRADPGTAFEVWYQVYREEFYPSALEHGFAVSLFERAIIDAVCRAARCSFFTALKEDLLGFRAERIHPRLAGWDLAASLPEEPVKRVRVRHTIGLLDPLRVDDLDQAHRVDDGLPVALEEDVRRYGLEAFKVKIGGDPDADARRLNDLAEFLPQVVEGDWFVTLDGNEQYTDLASLVRLLERTDPTFVERIAFVEQPFGRWESAAGSVERFPKDVVLDEGDGGIEDFPRCLARGYRGVTVKNCKGVFRALLNRGLCDLHPGAFQTAEDLTNLPVLSLQQDLATVAAFGLAHVERNGHHYFRGLDHLPEVEARAALAAHPELYETREGGIFLRIEEGLLDLSSLQCPGYGVASPIAFEAREPVGDWMERRLR